MQRQLSYEDPAIYSDGHADLIGERLNRLEGCLTMRAMNEVVPLSV